MKRQVIVYALVALVAASVVFNLWVVLSGNTYLYRCFLHRWPGIDDWGFFENREVAAGKAQPWPLSAAYNQKALSEQRELFIRDKMKTVAFLLVKDGELFFEKYWEDHGPDSISSSFSMAKSIISILIGIAIDEGRLEGVQQTLGDILPQYATTDKARIRIVDLLTMSSGLDYREGYNDPFADSAESYYTSDLAAQARRLKLVAEPGRFFVYQSANQIYLAQILHKVSGTSVSRYASERLWRPLGARRKALWSLDRKGGMEKAYCCFNATARDFARLGLLYLNKGAWKGRQIVSEGYVADSIKPAGRMEVDGRPCKRYGYSWWLMDHRGHQVFMARGILGQYIVAIPAKKGVLVRLGHKMFGMHHERRDQDTRYYIDTALELLE